jgi:hypothetical protein
VDGAAEISMPVIEYGGCERKHANEAPAGPAPTIRRGVSMTFGLVSGMPLAMVECGMATRMNTSDQRILGRREQSPFDSRMELELCMSINFGLRIYTWGMDELELGNTPFPQTK